MKLPRVKEVHNPVRLPNNRIRIGSIQYGVGSEIEDDKNGTIWNLLKLMDGSRGIPEIVSHMEREHKVDPNSTEEALGSLISAGFICDADSSDPMDLTVAERARYIRNQSYFAWVDTQPRDSIHEVQSKLKKARVTLLGLGGSGGAVAMSLVATGIGSLHCVDFDFIEDSNLNRQLLYTEEDIGASKVLAAVSRLQALNSHVSVTGEQLSISSAEQVATLMKNCDLFILCADKPAESIMHWTNEAALSTNTSWSFCVYAGPMMVVGTFVPQKTPCFECLDHYRMQQSSIRDGEKPEFLYDRPEINAVIASTANLTGHLGALEAIYLLGGLRPQTLGRVFHQNLMVYDHIYYIEPPFWAECPMCGEKGKHRELEG